MASHCEEPIALVRSAFREAMGAKDWLGAQDFAVVGEELQANRTIRIAKAGQRQLQSDWQEQQGV